MCSGRKYTRHALTSYSKNRRDGATVSTRVLSLADRCGRKLFETATMAGSLRPPEENIGKAQPRKQHRRTAISTRPHL
jgi:hypothetical protein